MKTQLQEVTGRAVKLKPLFSVQRTGQKGPRELENVGETVAIKDQENNPIMLYMHYWAHL